MSAISSGIDRVDILKVTNGFRVVQFQKGVGVALATDDIEEERAANLEKALAERGWIIRRWAGGARAFRGELYPIRTTEAIKRLRDNLRAYPRPDLDGQAHALDLRYDL